MDYLLHYGIKGQKHGVRRWQYQDGSLTPEGYPHYGYKGPRKAAIALSNAGKSIAKSYRSLKVNNAWRDAARAAEDRNDAKSDLESSKWNKAAAGQRYVDASDAYNASAKKMDKINNSAYAKLIGYSGRTHRKTNEQLQRNKEQFDIASREYENAKIDTKTKKLIYQQYSDVADYKNSVANTQTQNVINRYGEQSYNELYGKYKKLSYYQSIA